MTSKETTATPNTQKSENKNSEPITQVQRDSVITREDMPAKPFRIGVTLVTLGSLLLFFAFYFGIINV
jgi:hypothetical protein